jgi:ABC-type transporter Mla MlaB component
MTVYLPDPDIAPVGEEVAEFVWQPSPADVAEHAVPPALVENARARMTTSWKASAWIDASEENGTLVLRVCGELDMASRDAIEPALLAAVTSVSTVILDLHDLSFCDSCGLATFVNAAQGSRDRADRDGRQQ